MRLLKLAGLTSALLGTTALSPCALAQEQTAAPAAAERQTIVVTARRREEDLQETPVAVSAFDTETLERLQLGGTEDLDRVTPNLQFTSYGNLTGNNSAAQVFIRGIGQVDATAAVDPGVGIYIDDVYMGRSVGGAMDFRDIADVQVLRGPQGTLFGRNTIGGAVLMSTTRPGNEFGGVVRIGAGEENLLEGFAAVDIPIADQLAARVSAGIRQRDGYVTRSVDGVDLGDENTWSTQGSLVWSPSDSLEIVVRGDYASEDENGSPFVFRMINEQAAFVAAASRGAGCPGATFPPPNVPANVDDDRCGNDLQYRGPFTNGGTAPVYSTLENFGGSLTAEWEATDWLTLTSITAARRLEWTGARDADNTPLLILHTQYASESEQVSQEVRAGLDFGKLQGVVGAYYFDEDSFDEVRIDLAAPPPAVAAGGPGSRDLQFVNLLTESTALFTEWSYDVTDALSVSAGLRWTEETKGLQGTLLNVNPRTNPDPSPLPTTAPPLFIRPDLFERKFESTIGSASVKYRFSPAVMTYLAYAQGFKSGGYNQRYNAPPPNFEPIGFDEETAETWEIGVKTNPTADLRVNLALFDTTYDDIQLTYRLGVVPLLFNAGEASISGAELEVNWTLGDLIVDASAGFLENSIDKITAVPGTTATVGPNNSLPYTPESTVSLGAGYDFRLGGWTLTPRLDATYTSSYFFDAANSVEVAQTDDVTTVNANITLADDAGGWKAKLSVFNLTDELYPVMGNSSMTTSSGYAEIIYARPRNVTVSIEKSF